MPSMPHSMRKHAVRFRDQGWLVDVVVKLVGSEFTRAGSNNLHRGAASAAAR